MDHPTKLSREARAAIWARLWRELLLRPRPTTEPDQRKGD